MGILDSLMFWKKNDSSSLDSLTKNQDFGGKPDLGLDTNMGFDSNPNLSSNTGLDSNMGMGQSQSQPQNQPSQFQSFQSPQSASMSDPSRPQSFGSLERDMQQQQPQHSVSPQSHMAKDIEIISSKLDAIRSAVDSMNQRIANIERMIYDREQNDRVKQEYRNMPQRPY